MYLALYIHVFNNTFSSNANQQPSDIPESVINKFPLEKVRERGPLLAPGMQCRICLRGYEVNQFVRKLPRCKHKVIFFFSFKKSAFSQNYENLFQILKVQTLLTNFLKSYSTQIK